MQSQVPESKVTTTQYWQITSVIIMAASGVLSSEIASLMLKQDTLGGVVLYGIALFVLWGVYAGAPAIAAALQMAPKMNGTEFRQVMKIPMASLIATAIFWAVLVTASILQWPWLGLIHLVITVFVVRLIMKWVNQ